jgi:copper chaperone CopZ
MIVLTVEGMTCDGCVRSVTRALTRLDPDATVTVSLAGGRVEVASARSRADLAAAVTAAGFGVRPE